jgi:hypothetical protein
MSQPKQIDARAPRWSAGFTTVVLIIALLTKSTWLTIWQLAVFAVAAFINISKSPYGIFYKKVIRPRLSGEVPLEDSRPPVFAQLVGFGFVLVATIGALTHNWAVFTVAMAGCIFAAFLNSAFDYCLGCKIYLLGIRIFR